MYQKQFLIIPIFAFFYGLYFFGIYKSFQKGSYLVGGLLLIPILFVGVMWYAWEGHKLFEGIKTTSETPSTSSTVIAP